jgi:hypothetical protein
MVGEGPLGPTTSEKFALWGKLKSALREVFPDAVNFAPVTQVFIQFIFF